MKLKLTKFDRETDEPVGNPFTPDTLVALALLAAGMILLHFLN